MIGRASAPASSANLGPGFDCLALALELRCTVTLQTADSWKATSNGKEVEENALRLIAAAAEQAGAVGEFDVSIATGIPIARGLGSSAALVAAVAAAVARHQGRKPESDRIFDITAHLDGHPDNAAAAVFGGLVAVADRHVRPLPLASTLMPVVAVPAYRLSTDEARRALPAQVTHSAAARNVARAVFLVEGLRSGDPAAFAAAAGDELHEPHRSTLSPITADLIDAARGAGALHACWSGAGPSVLALTVAEARPSVVSALSSVLGDAGRVVTPEVAASGLL